jgi:hypothetical protein
MIIIRPIQREISGNEHHIFNYSLKEAEMKKIVKKWETAQSKDIPQELHEVV